MRTIPSGKTDFIQARNAAFLARGQPVKLSAELRTTRVSRCVARGSMRRPSARWSGVVARPSAFRRCDAWSSSPTSDLRPVTRPRCPDRTPPPNSIAADLRGGRVLSRPASREPRISRSGYPAATAGLDGFRELWTVLRRVRGGHPHFHPHAGCRQPDLTILVRMFLP